MFVIRPLSPFEQRILAICQEKLGTFSLSALSIAAGLSKETIPKWVKQARGGDQPNPSAVHLKKLASFAGVSVDWLLSEEPFLASYSRQPDRGELNAIRERLEARGYDPGTVADVLWGTDFSGAARESEVFDLAERELAKRGLAPNFAPRTADESGEVPTRPQNIAPERRT